MTEILNTLKQSRKDLGQNPDLIKSSNGILDRIKERLRIPGFLGRSEELRLQDIFIPKIYKKFKTDTLTLESLGLSEDFSDRFVIFIKNEKNEINKNHTFISIDQERQGRLVEEEGPKNINLRIHLSDLFLDKHKVSDISLKNTGVLGVLGMSFFERQGIMRDTVILGNISQDEESVLLVVDNADGVASAFSLVLPKNWRDSVDENGRLIGGTEEKQNESKLITPSETNTDSGQVLRPAQDVARMTGSGEQTETPEQKLQNEVLRRIEKHLNELGLEFDPRDISVPSVTVDTSDYSEPGVRTREALIAAKLSGGFSVICVGGEKEQHFSVAGSSSTVGIMFVFGFKTGGGLSSFKYSCGSNPSVFVSRGNNTEFRLGRDWLSQEEHVLLAFIKNGRRELSSLALPAGWIPALKSVLENGKLKPVEPVKQPPQERVVGKPVPIVPVASEVRVSLKTPKKTEGSYTQEQLKEMEEKQWEDYDIAMGREGRISSRGDVYATNYRFEGERSFVPASHQEESSPFRNVPSKVRKEEKKKRWKEQEQARASSSSKGKKAEKSKKGK